LRVVNKSRAGMQRAGRQPAGFEGFGTSAGSLTVWVRDFSRFDSTTWRWWTRPG
jgi:hypothetical protein